MENAGARLRWNGVQWAVVACLFTDGTAILADSERELMKEADLPEKEAKNDC